MLSAPPETASRTVTFRQRSPGQAAESFETRANWDILDVKSYCRQREGVRAGLRLGLGVGLSARLREGHDPNLNPALALSHPPAAAPFLRLSAARQVVETCSDCVRIR